MQKNSSEEIRCSESMEDTDSRDSGIYMEADTRPAEQWNFLPTRKQRWNQKISELAYLPQLVEEMEEVALYESLHDLTEAEKETEQHLRRLSRKIRTRTTPRKALTDLTNSSEWNQSPRTHTELSKRLHGVISHAPGANSFDTFSRHESFYEGKGCRKRCSHPEQPNAKRRYDVCRTDDGNEEEYVGEPVSISLMRVQSTSYIESGRCARDQLPGLLHVDYSLRTLSKPQIDSVAFKSIDGHFSFSTFTLLTK
uniref:M-phase inducer phosphatase n=1 Tax=Parascaris univalens TaxID=6257 RepID=A0A915BP24_PARUN